MLLFKRLNVSLRVDRRCWVVGFWCRRHHQCGISLPAGLHHRNLTQVLVAFMPVLAIEFVWQGRLTPIGNGNLPVVVMVPPHSGRISAPTMN